MLGIWAKSGLLPGLINKVLLEQDRKSTRLNSSHLVISYAVFCLKKKNFNQNAVTTFNIKRSPSRPLRTFEAQTKSATKLTLCPLDPYAFLPNLNFPPAPLYAHLS